jgi:hypothetical protein
MQHEDSGWSSQAVTIYLGIDPKHFRLSLISRNPDYSLVQLTGVESNSLGVTANLDSGKTVEVPFGLAAVDVESSSISVVSASSNKVGYYVCYEAIPN